MWFGMVGQIGPWMRQVVGFGDQISSWEAVTLGVNVGHPIVTNEKFAAYYGLFPNYFGQSCFSWI